MIAFVFPGQGAQSIGMVDALAAEFPQIQHRFEQASAALGMDLWELVRAGPIEQLNLTQNTQRLPDIPSGDTGGQQRRLGVLRKI